MKVFHGSTAIVRDPDVSAGRDHLDFGKGFYLTDLEEQAISWATRPMNASKLSEILKTDIICLYCRCLLKNRHANCRKADRNGEQIQ